MKEDFGDESASQYRESTHGLRLRLYHERYVNKRMREDVASQSASQIGALHDVWAFTTYRDS